MAVPTKAPAKVDQKVWWEQADWKKIEDGAAILAAETHMDVTPTDFVRTAVRRFYDTLTEKSHD